MEVDTVGVDEDETPGTYGRADTDNPVVKCTAGEMLEASVEVLPGVVVEVVKDVDENGTELLCNPEVLLVSTASP